MTRPDPNEQADFGDGTLGWTAEAFDGNRIDPITGGYKRLGRVHCRAVDEPTAYEVAKQKFDQRGIRRVGRVITIKPASYADLEMEPLQGVR